MRRKAHFGRQGMAREKGLGVHALATLRLKLVDGQRSLAAGHDDARYVGREDFAGLTELTFLADHVRAVDLDPLVEQSAECTGPRVETTCAVVHDACAL